jgi:hypothetical protein
MGYSAVYAKVIENTAMQVLARLPAIFRFSGMAGQQFTE